MFRIQYISYLLWPLSILYYLPMPAFVRADASEKAFLLKFSKLFFHTTQRETYVFSYLLCAYVIIFFYGFKDFHCTFHITFHGTFHSTFLGNIFRIFFCFALHRPFKGNRIKTALPDLWWRQSCCGHGLYHPPDSGTCQFNLVHTEKKVCDVLVSPDRNFSEVFFLMPREYAWIYDLHPVIRYFNHKTRTAYTVITMNYGIGNCLPQCLKGYL